MAGAAAFVYCAHFNFRNSSFVEALRCNGSHRAAVRCAQVGEPRSRCVDDERMASPSHGNTDDRTDSTARGKTMSFNPADLNATHVDNAFLETRIQHHQSADLPRLQRMWDYYRNDLRPVVSSGTGALGRPYRLAQDQGLPQRLIGPNTSHTLGDSTRQREVVIENDIAWRIHTLTDFMFAKPIVIQSLSPDPDRRALIDKFIGAVLQANGGPGFFHDLSLLGSVYGFVDLLVRVNAGPSLSRLRPSANDQPEARLMQAARHFVVETIEAPRAIPMLDPDDYRRLDAYVLHFRRRLNRVQHDSLLQSVRRRVLGHASAPAQQAVVERTQVWTDQNVLTFEGDESRRVLVDEAVNTLGRIPIVHIQNLSQPFFYEGLSEVEPLIPLQDELNTRLSDRANRVTFQSFKMYLGKGIEQFTERPVGPGQMWSTENTDASIEAFGGDGDSPSEDSHINEIREAMDKISGVTAVAAGLLRNKVGNLTSENALRIVMMGLLAKTEKRRVTYGAGIAHLCELLLHAADITGILPNDPADRAVRLDWPNPLPADEAQHLRNAKVKVDIGVPKEQVLAELGYADRMAM